MRLSIVATLYRSAEYVEAFHQRASAAAREVSGDNYQIVLVNDGSPDASLDIAVRLTEGDSHLVVVDLSRNFGHHKAMMTGLAHSRGELVFLIDSDLEEEPEWLVPFHAQLTSDACDVVYGVQAKRKGGWFERWTGDVFYSLLPKISGVDMPRSMVTARLMTRRYVDALLLHREREIDIGGLWVITGYEQRPQVVRKHHTSQTTYSISHKFALLVNSITAFSNLPLVAIFYVGMAVFLVAAAFAIFFVLQWMWLDAHVSGWTSLIVSIWLLGGMMISFLGVIGIYLAKMFSEVTQRPSTLVRKIHEHRP
jgi:putative glycosyltransferase